MIRRMSNITIGRCKTCRLRTDDGYCTSPQIREDELGTVPKTDDELVYDYYEDGRFWVGPNFGCVHWTPIADSTHRMSAEQQARDLLERMEIPNAQDFSAGELVELANLIAGIRD
jgi:hypothetical protein